MSAVRRVLLAVLLLACGFAAGVVLLGRMRADEQASAQTTAPRTTSIGAPAATAATVIAPTAAALPDFSRVAERTIPAVVNVSSQQVVERALSSYEAFLYGARGVRSLETSLGSGVLVSPDGYILTNNHVVTGDGRASVNNIVELTVTLSDDQKMPAKVIATDEGTDLALLKVDGKNLPVIAWGDSDKLKVAEWVLAIGNPYQLNESVSLGIVSALNRKDYSINQFGTFIQTDAAINPGNSGGALINASGELIGINTAIFTQSGGYQGIGFAVASNLARQVMDDLLKYGQVRRGTIVGMNVIDLNARLAQRLRLAPNTEGIVVNEIGRGSSTDRAGFQPGDVIVSFNGTPVTNGQTFIRLVGETKIGSSAVIGVVRNGRRLELKIPIEQTSQPQTR
jgi:S1-C subfamily serine protease